MTRLQKFVHTCLRLYASGGQDAETTGLDIVHAIVHEGDDSLLSYFLEVSPKEVVEGAAKQMARLKKDTGFMIPGFFWSPPRFSDEELERMAIERKARYEEVYEVLKRETARLSTDQEP